jgi:hypothetical protein
VATTTAETLVTTVITGILVAVAISATTVTVEISVAILVILSPKQLKTYMSNIRYFLSDSN